MINSINIGKVVFERLKTLTNSVYPLIAENGTNYPFIIYQRDSITPSFCKDGQYEDDVMITVKVVASTYYGSLDLAQDVRTKLTFNDLAFDNMQITSKLYTATEGYEQDAYVQTLTFELKINNI